jgi:hypothetical protein
VIKQHRIFLLPELKLRGNRLGGSLYTSHRHGLGWYHTNPKARRACKFERNFPNLRPHNVLKILFLLKHRMLAVRKRYHKRPHLSYGNQHFQKWDVFESRASNIGFFAHLWTTDFCEYYFFYFLLWSQNSVVGIATDYVLHAWGVEVWVPVGARTFSSPGLPDRFCGPAILLSNVYRELFPRE